MTSHFTYNKTEKLKSRKAIENVFANGKSFLVFPLKVFYFFEPLQAEDNIHCGVGVSKKYFAKAVDRNRIKRLLREAYRLNKTSLHITVAERKINFFVLFIDKNLPSDYKSIEPKMKQVIDKLIKLYGNEMAL